jgi:N-acyl-D-amino-acid deacylase
MGKRVKRERVLILLGGPGWRWFFGGLLLAGWLLVCPLAVSSSPEYDLVLREGTIYDGSGGVPFTGDVAVRGDAIVAIGPRAEGRGRQELNVRGLAVAPGFINMLSWAAESLLVDGRSQSDIRQGVTLEVLGEGWSMGPLNEAIKAESRKEEAILQYEIAWTTLGEYLDHLVKRGVSTNVASFVGATTVRVHVLGYENRAPTREELERMRGLVAEAMEEGAMGLSTALIYAPASYAETEELIALAGVAARYGGMYISHMRNEGSRIEEALEELIRIAREAGIRSEIYHLKLGGKSNWSKLDPVIRRIEAARSQGIRITANMYNYTASATSLSVLVPEWAHEGGRSRLMERLRDPLVRKRIQKEMSIRDPQAIVVSGFRNPGNRPLEGKTLAEIAERRKASPEQAALDLLVEDHIRLRMSRFGISEENIRKQIRLPWVSFGSDGASLAPEGVFLELSVHPRSYGNFARLLGKYVRQMGIIPLEEAIRRLTSLPAENLKLDRRGSLRPGSFADIVVFDPGRVDDHATYGDPHRYATGMVHVFVNGVQVLREGGHTGAKPGRVVRGPGWKGTQVQKGR